MISNPIFLSVIVTMVLAGMTGVERKSELEVVGAVDLSRYAGRWYEIARLPNRFEKKCVDSVTATYTLRPDGKVKVVNRCRKANGKYTTATGKAKVVDKKTNAKLKVSHTSNRQSALRAIARKDGDPRLRNTADDPHVASDSARR